MRFSQIFAPLRSGRKERRVDHKTKSSSTLRAFGSAMWSHWFTAMSGPLSVPVAAAALWVANDTAKVLLGLTAFSCIWAAAYAVWKAEREKVVDLENKSGPLREREIEAQEAHTEALRQQTAAPEAQLRENDPLMKQLRSWAAVPKVLELSVGTDHEYYDIPKYSLHGFTKRYKLKLQNKHSHKTISSGRVQIMELEPQCGYRGPWLIAEHILLAAGDHIYLPLASYGEVRESGKGNVADDAFQIETLNEHRPLLGIETEHYATVRATAADVPFCEIRCKLWVDAAGRFQIEKV
jgi:hypothetical protein